MTENEHNHIIPRADDAGSHPEANEAIFDAARRGWLKNISFMAAGPTFPQAAEMSRGITSCDFGMHVSLTSEWRNLRFRPLTSSPGLPVDEQGYCLPDPRLLLERGISLEAVMDEVEAQYQTLVDAGLEIRYVDEHMGCSWLHEPGRPERRLCQLLAEFCEQNGLVWFASRHRRGIPHSAFENEQSLHDFFQSHQGGCLYMTHPAFDRDRIHDDALARPDDTPGQQSALRQLDHDRLTNHRWAEIIHEHGYRILRYSEAPVDRPDAGNLYG